MHDALGIAMYTRASIPWIYWTPLMARVAHGGLRRQRAMPVKGGY